MRDHSLRGCYVGGECSERSIHRLAPHTQQRWEAGSQSEGIRTVLFRSLDLRTDVVSARCSTEAAALEPSPSLPLRDCSV